MVRSGKVSPLVVIGVAGIIGIAALLSLLQAKDSPGVRVNKFFTALAKGNVDDVMSVSTFGGEPAETVRKKWEVCLHRAEFFRFYWKVKETFTPNPDEAIVAVDIYLGVDKGDMNSKRYQIPLSRENGEWVVDAKSLNREIYPALPR